MVCSQQEGTNTFVIRGRMMDGRERIEGDRGQVNMGISVERAIFISHCGI